MSTTTIATAARQYAYRPKDERFATLDSLIAAAMTERDHCRERAYYLKDLKVVTMDGDDLGLQSDKGTAAFSNWSFGQLAATVKAPAAYLRDRLTPQLAADCLNHGLQTSGVGVKANLLVRGSNGKPPIIRAATSDSYGRLWDSEFYSGAKSAIFDHGSQGRPWIAPTAWSGQTWAGCRGDRDSFVIQVDGGSIVTDPSAANNNGQMYRGVMLRNSEVGAASVVIECVMFRYICGNFMLWGAVMDRTFKRRHVGKAVLHDTIEEIGKIAHKWTDRPASADEQIIRYMLNNRLATTKDGLIDALRAMNATQEQAEQAYLRTVQDEPNTDPLSYWGIANGITRLSQDEPYADDRFALDRLAATVLARAGRLVAA